MHVRRTLADEVDAGDAAVDDPVLHVLGNVGRPDQQHLDGSVPARERERALARLLGPEARVLEELVRRLAQPAFGRQRDPQELSRSSASR